MRKLFAIVVVVLLSVPALALNRTSDRELREPRRDSFVVKIVKKLIRGITTTSDGLTVPRP